VQAKLVKGNDVPLARFSRMHPSVHLEPGDLRRQLIEHARDPSSVVSARTSQRMT
jgi:hypothetical protein